MYLMGVQCSNTVQPVFGRSPLFQQQNGVFQSNSNSPNNSNEIGSSASLVGAIGNSSATAFHHLNSTGSAGLAPSPVHLHQLNVTHNQTNGLNSSNNRNESTNVKLHNSSLMRNGSLNNSNNNLIAPTLLDYFPNAGNDGLGISWCHGINNRARLNHALSSK